MPCTPARGHFIFLVLVLVLFLLFLLVALVPLVPLVPLVLVPFVLLVLFLLLLLLPPAPHTHSAHTNAHLRTPRALAAAGWPVQLMDMLDLVLTVPAELLDQELLPLVSLDFPWYSPSPPPLVLSHWYNPD